MSYKCLLFDLDGTLVDSRADLAHSVNLMLAELDRQELSSCRVLNFVGEGARLLVERALAATQDGPPLAQQTDLALQVFLRHYREHLLDQTRVYSGVEETLAALDYLPKAVVTNKPYDFTVALLEGLGLRAHFDVIFGGDSLPERKPSPMMLLEAARHCGVAPSACLMVGDTKFDVMAGRAAGMKTCGYVPGFRGRTELAEAGADFLIERFSELCLLVECARRHLGSVPQAVASVTLSKGR
ncbi:MAG: phosphoglycolate phosphatase [Acidobacteriota bacterium]|nr:phosphoglycolate phosphatase [Acidobacteriota bacterium]